MTPEERAHSICTAHLEDFPAMPNVPIQSVYEWFVAAQLAAIAEEREAEDSEPQVWPFGVDTGHMWRLGMSKSIAAAIRARAAE